MIVSLSKIVNDESLQTDRTNHFSAFVDQPSDRSNITSMSGLQKTHGMISRVAMEDIKLDPFLQLIRYSYI